MKNVHLKQNPMPQMFGRIAAFFSAVSRRNLPAKKAKSDEGIFNYLKYRQHKKHS